MSNQGANREGLVTPLPPPAAGGALTGSLVPSDPDRSTYSCGIDYWSATLPRSNPLYDALVATARAVAWVPGSGTLLKAGGNQGYAGHTGNNVFVGERDDGAYVSATGGGSERVYYQLAGNHWKATRIDLEVTVWKDGINSSAARAARELSVTQWAGSGKSPLPTRIITFQGNDGGHTLYIGAASSSARARVYDKGVQSGEAAFDGACRFELQYRHVQADKCSRMLSALPGDREQWILAHLAAWFRERGVTLPIKWDDECSTWISRHKPRTDAYRRIQWLKDTVRPALDKLRLELTVEELRGILGLGY